MNRSASPKVCLDARLHDGVPGGVQQYVMGLAAGLAALENRHEDYSFLTFPGSSAWLEPYLASDMAVLPASVPVREGIGRAVKASIPGWLKRRLPATPRLDPVWKTPSDGTIEKAAVDVMHFTNQDAFLTDIPSIYQPWDLQHIHLPEMFSGRERQTRNAAFKLFSDRAAALVVATSWTKRDLRTQLDLPEEKIHVVPPAGALSFYDPPSESDLETLRREHPLPGRFLLYPAHTWPHKNHLRLVDALALLRDDGVSVPLVLTGAKTNFYPRVRAHVSKLGLEDDVRHLGFVSPTTMYGLYKLSDGVVFPSLFEGWGLPVCESWFAGVPIACSTATSLPDLAGDAALLFDPTDTSAIAEAIRELWSNDDTRRSLVERGRLRSALFTWEETTRGMRAVYRSVAGAELDDEDRKRLVTPPLV